MKNAILGMVAEASAETFGLFAQVGSPPDESFLAWTIRSLGLLGFLVLLLGLAIFLGACVVVVLAREEETGDCWSRAACPIRPRR